MNTRILEFFIPGKIRRQSNGPQRNFYAHARYRKAWRTRAQVIAMATIRQQHLDILPDAPKTIRLRARVFNLFDDDGLAAALKPCLDGIRDSGLIHSDAPFEKSGHRILRSQRIDRQHEGVEILVDVGVDNV